MSSNRPNNDTPGNTGTTSGGTGAGATGGGVTGGAGTGATGAGTTRDDSTTGMTRSTGTAGTGAGSTGAGAATGIAAQAQQYGQKLAEAATSAREYVTDKAGIVGERITDLRNKDYGQMAEEAKEYARQKPGQALLISAAAGFVIGLLIRGSRR